MRPKAALLTVALAGCLPISFSGSNRPTEHTFKLTAEDITAAEDTVCHQKWVGSDAEKNRKEALARFEKRGVQIVKKSPIRMTVAARNRLFVGKGFDDKTVAEQAELLTHELVHYCQRDELGNDAFDLAYAHSAGRWRAEVPAYGQSILTKRQQGASEEEVQQYIDRKLDSMRTKYYLHDIDPDQYVDETSRIWSAAE